jgi:hypothetical protein
MHPEFYGEIFKRGKMVKRFYWRLRNFENDKIVARGSGGRFGAYTTEAECARMFDRIFEGQYPLNNRGNV